MRIFLPVLQAKYSSANFLLKGVRISFFAYFLPASPNFCAKANVRLGVSAVLVLTWSDTILLDAIKTMNAQYGKVLAYSKTT
jgi:hypothetical protein